MSQSPQSVAPMITSTTPADTDSTDDIESSWSMPDAFGLGQQDKAARLLARLNRLTVHHANNCPPYRQLLQAFTLSPSNTGYQSSNDYSQLPYVASGLFKAVRLLSVAEADVLRVMRSSGTGGQASQIILDRQTAAAQSQALVTIMQSFLGPDRLPMLLFEPPGYVHSHGRFSARGAGVLGMGLLGRDHHYALNEDMSLNWAVINRFTDRYAGQRTLLFGLTFVIWQQVLQVLANQPRTLALDGGILVHGGGWKKLQHQAVDNQAFNQVCAEQLGITQVHNYYGMMEQAGSVFVSCAQGHFHAPLCSDVLVRHPITLMPQPEGEAGLLQVLSALPLSYPGHSILTEDLGILLGEDDCPCGRRGRYFTVLGRQQGSEVKGCSDTFS
ncbi:acyl-protein synthetase [Shewanella sp. NFH-SH190041]|uniref:LuxE/PaaK family acyltransferase n=1 Tax=Shewanella sp. NFH-SH190041 TaxID=2950245 RepID=UPI0021C3A13D|nr:acyl-protein synthetase [Shewanella sp. NFH-SH190041]